MDRSSGDATMQSMLHGGPLAQWVDAAVGPLLAPLLHQHGLLRFADVQCDDETLVAFARQLGPVEEVHPPEFRVPGELYVRLQSNVPGLGVNGAGSYWHSDGPWSKPPCAATVLFCVEAPAAGGETLFTDMRAALERLPAQLRERVDGLHGWFPCREIYRAELAALGLEDEAKLSELQDLEHPLVREHASTGTRALHLNEQWLRGVSGLAPDESARLLEQLYAVATDPSAVYTHRWAPGDLLVWDNASMMHRGLPSTAGTRKVTKRVTVAAGAESGRSS